MLTLLACCVASLLFSLLKRREITSRNDLPRNAVGEMMPVLLATTIAIPVSRNGKEKSIACDLSKLILRDVITISAWWLRRAATRPFHRPFCGHKDIIMLIFHIHTVHLDTIKVLFTN